MGPAGRVDEVPPGPAQKLEVGEAITPSELGRLYRANEDTRIGPNSQRAQQERAVVSPAAKKDDLVLTDDEENAILAYKSSESYKINVALRGGASMDLQTQKFVESLDSALKKLPVYVGTVLIPTEIITRNDGKI